MTKNSPEYLKATDDDIALWYQTQLAKKHLDGFLNGYDPEDDELTTDQLRQKYNPKTLESKAIQFAAYDLDTQREKLIAAMTGTKAEVDEKREKQATEFWILRQVKFFRGELKKIGRLNEWIERSCDFETYNALSLEGKTKYHNDLVAFHDEEMKKLKSTPPPAEMVVDSPPHPSMAGGGIDFEDSSKWEAIE